MAIDNTTRKTVVMLGDGSTVDFPFAFRINNEEDLKVYVKIGPAAYVLQSLGVDYDLVDLQTDTYGNITGGNIRYPKIGTPLTADDSIYAIRETPNTQLEDSSQVSFQSKDVERALDKATMEIQELTEEVDRCLKVEAWQDISPDDILNSVYQSAADAAVSATNAHNSELSASGSANNAATSETNASKWAEGSDADVEALGGTHSSKGWAEQAEASAQSIDTAIANKANKDLDNLSVTGEAKFTAKANTDLDNLTDAGKSLIAELGLPSTVYEDLTLGASGTQYTAPSNGYVFLSAKTSVVDGQIQLTAQGNYNVTDRSYNQYIISILLPISKGKIFIPYYDGTLSNVEFRFIYSEGSKQEAQ